MRKLTITTLMHAYLDTYMRNRGPISNVRELAVKALVYVLISMLNVSYTFIHELLLIRSCRITAVSTGRSLGSAGLPSAGLFLGQVEPGLVQILQEQGALNVGLVREEAGAESVSVASFTGSFLVRILFLISTFTPRRVFSNLFLHKTHIYEIARCA